MNYPVIIRSEAESDISNAIAYYDEIKIELGQDLRCSIAECIDLLRQYPELYAPRYGKTRPVRLRRFPYLLSYVFENEVIVVLGVVHCSLQHETWNSRR